MADKDPITRSEIIIVAEVGENDYKDLIWKDKEGKEYKMGAKRRKYFDDVIVPDMAVKLNYAPNSFRPGTEYIHSAVQVKDALPEPTEPIEPEPVEDEPKIAKYAPQEITGQERGMCWKEIGELVRCEKLQTIYGKENALEIIKQYRGYLLSALKLNYDGKKLPQWETKKGE